MNTIHDGSKTSEMWLMWKDNFSCSAGNLEQHINSIHSGKKDHKFSEDTWHWQIKVIAATENSSFCSRKIEEAPIQLCILSPCLKIKTMHWVCFCSEPSHLWENKEFWMWKFLNKILATLQLLTNISTLQCMYIQSCAAYIQCEIKSR